jgi:hypothetical protein
MSSATETFAEARERRDREGRQLQAFLRRGPHEPLATPAEVLEVACPSCSAEPGQPCNTTFPRVSILGLALRGFSGIHTARYLSKTHDPR